MIRLALAFSFLSLVGLTACGEDHDHDSQKGGDRSNQTAGAFLKEDSRFSEFWETVKAAKLEGRFDEADLTVFAPTNSAFQKLSGDDKVAVLGSEAAAKAFVEMHIVGKAMKMGDLEAGKLETVGGKKLDVEIEDHGEGKPHAHVHGNHIDEEDVKVKNGFVHVMSSIFS